MDVADFADRKVAPFYYSWLFMKFRWFHIIKAKRFAKMIARARKSGYEAEHGKSNRIVSDLLQENTILKALLGRSKIGRRRRA